MSSFQIVFVFALLAIAGCDVVSRSTGNGSSGASRALSASNDPNDIVTDVLVSLGKAILAHDAATIGTCFADDCVLHKCGEKNDKAETVAQLAALKAVPKEVFKGFTAKFVNGEDEILVTTPKATATLRRINGKFVFTGGEVKC